ncbi:hypothetical protein QJS10_CPB20g01088 [Acorus calamus]|uniref:Uncharacterized protein n=1 Tax=Acorus calamus TaxID=4465 RepID=A0AAV9C8X4_ACOCL|nr:hypothetical protein QJS10_CPB20g01088 [Acorus calamus]
MEDIIMILFHCLLSSLKEQVSKEGFDEWDSLTAKFAGAANLPFLLLQLPPSDPPQCAEPPRR